MTATTATDTKSDTPSTETESVVARGKRWYEAGLRRKLETRANLGKFLLINPDTGEWEMGDAPETYRGDDIDEIIVSDRARARFGNTILFGMRIGYPTSAAIGGAMTPLPYFLGDEQHEDEQTP